MGEGGENHDVKGAFENAQQMNLKLVCLRRKEVFVNFVDMMTTVSKKKKKKEERKKKQWVIETPRLCSHELVGPRTEAQDTAVHI